MTLDSNALAKQIYEQARQLPAESLAELVRYMEFLRFKANDSAMESPTTEKLRIVNLRGLLKGYDFSPELLADARREMWHKLESEDA